MVKLSSSSFVVVGAVFSILPSLAAPVTNFDELDEVFLRDLDEVLESRDPALGALAGKILSKLNTVGTVASLLPAIGGLFKSSQKDPKQNKKRGLQDVSDEILLREFDDDDTLYMRMIAELDEEIASLERRYGNLEDLD